MSKRAEVKVARTHLDPKYRRHLRFMVVIVVLLAVIVTFDAFRYHASILQIGSGLILGFLIGLVSARLFKLDWDNKGSDITRSVDIYGLIVLIGYITFDLERNHIANLFNNSSAVPAVSLALLAGAYFGRIIGESHTILKILKEQQVFSSTNEEQYLK